MGPRKPIHANVSPEAFEAIQGWADHHGVSVTGFMESVGRYLFEHPNEDPLEEWAEPARRVDVERRRRPGREVVNGNH